MKKILLFSGLSQCNQNVCFHWTYDGSYLQLICKTDNLRFPVLFFDNNGKRLAKCLTPFPSPECHASNKKSTTVQQSFNKSETYVTVNTALFSNGSLNGSWSCHHGKNRHVATAIIYIPKVKGKCVLSKVVTW